MPTGELKEPLDSNGRPLKGRALEYHLRKQAELQAAAEAREDIEALLAGASMAEVADLIGEVRAERQQVRQEARATAAAAGHDPSVLWVTREGAVLRDGGTARGRPLVPQSSVVRRDVPELGSEPVPPAPPFTWGA